MVDGPSFLLCNFILFVFSTQDPTTRHVCRTTPFLFSASSSTLGARPSPEGPHGGRVSGPGRPGTEGKETEIGRGGRGSGGRGRCWDPRLTSRKVRIWSRPDNSNVDPRWVKFQSANTENPFSPLSTEALRLVAIFGTGEFSVLGFARVSAPAPDGPGVDPDQVVPPGARVRGPVPGEETRNRVVKRFQPRWPQ